MPQCGRDKLRVIASVRYGFACSDGRDKWRFARWYDQNTAQIDVMMMFLVKYGENEILVLAEDEYNAKQQATLEFHSYNVEEFIAARVPFMVRGCGGEKY